MGRPFAVIAPVVLLVGAALAQPSTAQTSEAATNSSSSPVAYVYVTRPTHLDGFAASSSGKLTAISGSPWSNIALSHLSVTKKNLFGASDDNQTIYSYKIASNGSVSEVASINTHNYNPDGNDCYAVGPTQLDFTGTILYNDDWNCDGDSQYIQSYKIEPQGDLTFLGNSGGEGEDYVMSAPVVLGTNKYLFTVAEYGNGYPGGEIMEYQRQSNGAMDLVNPNIEFPAAPNSGDYFTPTGPVLASDSSDHLAIPIQAEKFNGSNDGPLLLASFTVSSSGKVTTTNTPKQMATVSLPIVNSMSISPSGKLLAVGASNELRPDGKGFQLFHFNGASPITKYSGVLHSSESFVQFAWDKSNHLYALSTTNLHVYTVTSTSIKEVSGSPYSIPEASSLIVLSL